MVEYPCLQGRVRLRSSQVHDDGVRVHVSPMYKDEQTGQGADDKSHREYIVQARTSIYNTTMTGGIWSFFHISYAYRKIDQNQNSTITPNHLPHSIMCWYTAIKFACGCRDHSYILDEECEKVINCRERFYTFHPPELIRSKRWSPPPCCRPVSITRGEKTSNVRWTNSSVPNCGNFPDCAGGQWFLERVRRRQVRGFVLDE